MKLTTTTTVEQSQSVEIEERLVQVDGLPCIDFITSTHCVARMEIHSQPVGQAFRIINKLYVLPEAVPYNSPDDVDTSNIAPNVKSFDPYVGWVVPKEVKTKAAAKA